VERVGEKGIECCSPDAGLQHRMMELWWWLFHCFGEALLPQFLSICLSDQASLNELASGYSALPKNGAK